MGMLDEVHCNHELFNHQFFGVQKPSTLAIRNESSAALARHSAFKNKKRPRTGLKPLLGSATLKRPD